VQTVHSPWYECRRLVTIAPPVWQAKGKSVSESNPIRVFVTHLFRDDADYLRVFEYLENRENFFYLNCSNPDSIPATSDRDALREELVNQIKQAEVVVMPVTIYAANPELVRFQMDAAKVNGLQVIAIQAFGDTVALQKDVLERAAEVIEWNDRSITDAIRRQARHEDTSSWDVIEFKLD